ncbi:MAG TPA: peptidoglycan DD-metalloendopeptidase family protein, partial [Polyangia bacterium]
ERDEARGANAGRYVRLGHMDGTVVSRYIHLDSIREDLREGAHVHGGELIGRLGRTGVEHSGAHLHFALSMRPSGRGGPGEERYIDPEPMLRQWQLPSLPAIAMR